MSDDPDRIVEDLLPKPERLRDHMEQAIIDVLDLTVDNIRKLTPVDTGRLRNSINWRSFQGNPTGFTAVIGTNVEYAPFVEYTTSRSPGVAMFRRGIEQSREQGLKILRNAIREAMEL